MGFLQYMCLFSFLSATEVYSVDFTISKDKILIGSEGILTLACNITEKDVETVYLIQIRRSIKISGFDRPNWETLALMEAIKTESPTLSSDVIASAKNYVAGGAWNSSVPSSTYLTLSMNIAKIECADSREYKCELAYKSIITSAVKNYEMKRNFSVFATPRVTSLIGRKNGVVILGPSLSDMALFDIGDELELSCTANIGSFPETKIRWYRTSETASTDKFVEYRPGVGTFDDGSAKSDNQCGYIRTGHINYSITNYDAERANGLAFECYITVHGDPYGSLTTQTSPRFYLYVLNKSTPPITSTSGENLTDTIGIITLKGGNVRKLQFGTILGPAIAACVAGVAITLLILRRKNIGMSAQSRNKPRDAQFVQEAFLDYPDSSARSRYDSIEMGTFEPLNYTTVKLTM